MDTCDYCKKERRPLIDRRIEPDEARGEYNGNVSSIHISNLSSLLFTLHSRFIM